MLKLPIPVLKQPPCAVKVNALKLSTRYRVTVYTLGVTELRLIGCYIHWVLYVLKLSPHYRVTSCEEKTVDVCSVVAVALGDGVEELALLEPPVLVEVSDAPVVLALGEFLTILLASSFGELSKYADCVP